MPVHPSADERRADHRRQPQPDDRRLAPPRRAAREEQQRRHRQGEREKALEQPHDEATRGGGGRDVVEEYVSPRPEHSGSENPLAPKDNRDDAGDAADPEPDQRGVGGRSPELLSPQPANQQVRRQRDQQQTCHLFEEQRARPQRAHRHQRPRTPAPPQVDQNCQRRGQHGEELGVRRQHLGLVRRREHGVEQGRQPAGPAREPSQGSLLIPGVAPPDQRRRDGAGRQRGAHRGQRRHDVHGPHVVAPEQPKDGGVEVEDRGELVLDPVAVRQASAQHPAGNRRVRPLVDVHDRIDEGRRAQHERHQGHRQRTSGRLHQSQPAVAAHLRARHPNDVVARSQCVYDRR